jgi:hypothetical protein
VGWVLPTLFFAFYDDVSEKGKDIELQKHRGGGFDAFSEGQLLYRKQW